MAQPSPTCRHERCLPSPSLEPTWKEDDGQIGLGVLSMATQTLQQRPPTGSAQASPCYVVMGKTRRAAWSCFHGPCEMSRSGRKTGGGQPFVRQSQPMVLMLV